MLPAISGDAFSDLRVLIVDDSRQSRLIAAALLRQQGVSRLFFAEDGRQALHAALEHQPDLILLDLLMPELDGYGFCRAIRQQPGFAETPIIVQTGIEEAAGLAEAFSAGATDFVRKPIHGSELITRTRVHLERLALMRILRQQQQRHQEELQAARAMQDMMLPRPEQLFMLEAAYGVELAAHHQPCQALSGDLWSAQALDATRLALWQVDFTGHGLIAAMNAFRFHALTQGRVPASPDPGEHLTALNASLHELLPRHAYATMFYGVLDVESSMLHHASAAHTVPFLLRRDGTLERLEARGFPLGVVAGHRFESLTTPFEAGDLLFVYSDALIERREAFAEEELAGFLHTQMALGGATGPLAPAELLAETLSRFQTNKKRDLAEDDLTLLALSRH